MKTIYEVTDEFEKQLSNYTGSKYTIALDNASNAIFLALYYEKNIAKRITTDTISIPERTYPSVPCEIIHADLKVDFEKVDGKSITGAYNLKGSRVYDSALRFTVDMFIPDTHMCLSFTIAV